MAAHNGSAASASTESRRQHEKSDIKRNDGGSVAKNISVNNV